MVGCPGGRTFPQPSSRSPASPKVQAAPLTPGTEHLFPQPRFWKGFIFAQKHLSLLHEKGEHRQKPLNIPTWGRSGIVPREVPPASRAAGSPSANHSTEPRPSPHMTGGEALAVPASLACPSVELLGRQHGDAPGPCRPPPPPPPAAAAGRLR